jgi:capsular exopolysaccharide synthesis family protein
VGEISDALRRARTRRGGEAKGREKGDRIPAPDDLSKRVERRFEAPRQPSDQVEPSIAVPRSLSLGHEREGEWRARAVAVDGGSPTTESFRHLALRVRAELERRSLRSVAITGPLRNEGKTTVACNMALALASVSRGREVALVDLDLRRPSIAADFEIAVEVGIEEVLLGGRALSEVCVSIEKPAVDVFPAARPRESAHELLVQPGFASLVRELERSYATVIFDSPPVLLVPDASLILAHVSAYIAVARAGETRKRTLNSLVELLPRDHFLGTILNEGPLPTHRKQYGYYDGNSPLPAAEESQPHG